MQLDRPYRRRSSIGLTPLIDVVFILLVFFILAGNFEIESRFTLRSSVPLEEATAGALPVTYLRLGADDVRLGAYTGPDDEIADRLAAKIGQTGPFAVLLHPDDEVALGRMVLWIDRLQAMGITSIAIGGQDR